MIEKEERQRTIQQNKSVHLYCKMLSDAFGEAGLDMKKTLKPEIDIPWTPESAKDHLVHPIMKALYNKTSTADLSTVEMQKVYEILNRHTAEKFGISIEWPSRS